MQEFKILVQKKEKKKVNNASRIYLPPLSANTERLPDGYFTIELAL